jgi:hypothetical protein
MSFACRPPAFGNAGAVVNPLLGGLSEETDVFPSSANAAWQFNPDGSIDAQQGGGFAPDVQRWFDPKQAAVGAGYYIRATLVTGIAPGGSLLNTWLALSALRTWNHSRSSVGQRSCQLTIQIASDAAGSNIVSSGQFSLLASVEN